MPLRTRRASARAALFCGVAMAGALAAPPSALAWKPKTHVYLAEEAMKDALDDGRVTLQETDYRTGKIVGVLGQFEVDPKILQALRAAPDQFRAGVLGPDAYPDILTGQQVIHPDEAFAIDQGAGGSNAWLTHLWERGFIEGPSSEIQAFTVGYLTHAAGDIFAHTFVNHFAGGEFMLTPDPTNAGKHLILEGYIGKRTPSTFAASGAPISQENTSIAGVEGFIYDELTYARPGSILETKLLKGGGTSRSIPYVFSNLRNGLQRQVEQYDRIRLSKRGPERLAYAAVNGPGAEYKRAWIKDIDDGLRAFPAVSHELAKAIVYNEGGGDMKRAQDVMNQYVMDHLASMAGAPDAAVATAAFIQSVIDSILPQALRDEMKALMRAPLNAIIKGVTGKNPSEWADYLKNPDTHFNEVMNRPGGGHDGESDHLIDLATFNRDYLKIADAGYSSSGLKWKIEDLPPAFNTVQMTKMLMLGDAGMAQLDAALKAKGASMGSSPGKFRNLMLGWVRSLDAGNQWQGLTTHKAGISPQPSFAQNGGSAYQRLFLQQVGEKPWIAEQGGGPAAEVPVQDISGWVGEWETTYGRVKLVLDADGALRGRLMTDREGERLELRGGASVGTLAGTASYAAHVSQLTLTISEDKNSFTATNLPAGASSASAWSGKRIVAAPAEPQPAPAPAPARTPTSDPLPQPGPIVGAALQSLDHFQVRMDEARAISDRRVQVSVTLKNTSQAGQRILTGVFVPIMNDADGLGVTSAQLYRATGEPPELFATTPSVPPDGEFKLRFIFQAFPDGAPLRSFTLRESGGANVATFSIAGLRVPGLNAAARPPGSRPFQDLGDYDVRFDGGGGGRDGYLEAYFTFRNTSDEPRTIQPGALEMFLYDADGASTPAVGQMFSARGAGAEPLARSVTIEPGAEAMIRFKFRKPQGAPRKLTVGDGHNKLEYALPGG